MQPAGPWCSTLWPACIKTPTHPGLHVLLAWTLAWSQAETTNKQANSPAATEQGDKRCVKVSELKLDQGSTNLENVSQAHKYFDGNS